MYVDVLGEGNSHYKCLHFKQWPGEAASHSKQPVLSHSAESSDVA